MKFRKKPIEVEAYQMEREINSKSVEDMIWFTKNWKGSSSPTALTFNFITTTSSTEPFVKQVKPKGNARYETDMRFVIDGKNYDVSWEEFKKMLQKP